MKDKRYSGYGEQGRFINRPEPTRFAALAGEWRIEPHDDHPDNYVVSGGVAGEDFWETVGPENDAHIMLRAGAVARVPEMLRQLVETYDLLHELLDTPVSSLGEKIGAPDHPGGTEPRERRVSVLRHNIGKTLAAIDGLGERLGLHSFAVIDNSVSDTEAVDEQRFSDHGAAHAHARALSQREAAARGEVFGPEYLVVPARLVHGNDDGDGHETGERA